MKGMNAENSKSLQASFCGYDFGVVSGPAAIGESTKQGRRTLSGSGHARDCLPNGGIDLAGISGHQLDRRGDRWTSASVVVANCSACRLIYMCD